MLSWVFLMFLCLLSQHLNPGGHNWRQGPLSSKPSAHSSWRTESSSSSTSYPRESSLSSVPLILTIHLIQSNISSCSRPLCSVNTKWTLICLLSGFLFISLGSAMRFTTSPLPPPPTLLCLQSTQSCPEQKVKDFGAWAWTWCVWWMYTAKRIFHKCEMGVQPLVELIWKKGSLKNV